MTTHADALIMLNEAWGKLRLRLAHDGAPAEPGTNTPWRTMGEMVDDVDRAIALAMATTDSRLAATSKI